MRISDWSSDVCSSDLALKGAPVFDQAVGKRRFWSQFAPDPFLDERTGGFPHVDVGVEAVGNAFHHHHRLLQQQKVRLGLHVEIARDGELAAEHLPYAEFLYRLAAHSLAHTPQAGRDLRHVLIRGTTLGPGS